MRCRRFLFIITAWAAILAGTAAASAQPINEAAVTEADRAAVAGCLRESPDAPRACIGAIAVVCARQASGDRRDAEIDCSRREAAVWRERLEAAARMLAPRLESGARSRFAAVQRSWESYAAQKCAFLAEIEPAERMAAMQSACDLREVAARSIEIERLIRRRNPAESRPQLQR